LPDPECADHGDCGELQACRGGTCFGVQCTDASDCPIEQRCTDSYECKSGCDEDEDCLAGFACEDHTCVVAECETTSLDCSVGELCTEGACEGVEGLCGSCSDDTDCADGLTCLALERFDDRCETDEDCPDGYQCEPKAIHPCTDHCSDGTDCVDGYCYEAICATSLCTMACSAEEQDCPGGFLCDAYSGGEEPSHCYANCTYLEEQGLYP